MSDIKDICVIGGGLAGLYYVYKTDINIDIYESDNRTGGRYKTNYSHGIISEYGAIRYEWGYQPFLEQLITELGIELCSFPPFCNDKGFELEFIKEICVHLWSIYLNKDINLTDITLENINNVYNKNWLPYNNKLIYPYDIYMNDYIKNINIDWYNKLKDIEENIRTFPVDNWTVLFWLLRWTKLLITNKNIKTVKNGNEEVVKRLSDNIKNINLNHKLYKIYKENNYYKLYFTNNIIISTKKIILTIPLNNINELNYNFPNKTLEVFEKIKPFKLGRVYVYLNNPTWDDDFNKMQNHMVEELNTREIYYFKNNDKTIGLIMLYFDEIYFNHWINKTNDEIKYFFINKGFNNIFDIQTIFWDGLQYPIAFHYIDKNINPEYAINTLLNADKNISIIGDCSFEPGFIEGVLININKMIS